MTVTRITSTDPWQMTLPSPAEVVDGVAQVNLAATVEQQDARIDALADYLLLVYLRDCESANGFVGHAVVPQGGAGDVVRVEGVTDDAVVGGTLVLTAAIGEGLNPVPIVDGELSLNSPVDRGTRCGPVFPTASNTVVDGDVVAVIVSGTNMQPGGTATVTLTIRRTT